MGVEVGVAGWTGLAGFSCSGRDDGDVVQEEEDAGVAIT